MRKTEKKKSSQKNKLENYLVEREKLLEVINTIPSHEAICYTDGSALGNPGPSGAGAALTYPSPDGAILVEGIHGLGRSTNNVGELWAIAMAVQMINHFDQVYNQHNTPLHIFSDSMYNMPLDSSKVTSFALTSS